MFQSIVGHTARQHAQFGVTASQLAAFGEALIWVLEEQFGSAFTSGLRQAWIYESVKTEMMHAAQIRS
jgi:hemoglobin-like flavoprotein